jgi:hypothetical protein
MDPELFEQWRKEGQAKIDEKIANKEEIHVPLHNLFWSDGKADKVPGTNSKMTQQENPAEYLELLSKKYCMLQLIHILQMADNRLTTTQPKSLR